MFKKKDITQELKKIAMMFEKASFFKVSAFHPNNDFFPGLDYNTLISQVYHNYPREKITEKVIFSEFEKILKVNIKDAKNEIKKYMEDIFEELDSYYD